MNGPRTCWPPGATWATRSPTGPAPGLESRHNLTYWRNLPYLGVGPGAHSYLGGCRFAHCTQPAAYINRVAQWADRGAVPGEGEGAAAFGAIPTVAAVETIDRQTEMAETLIMGLRLEEGVSFAGFADRFGVGLLEVYRWRRGRHNVAGIGRGHRRRRRLSDFVSRLVGDSWATRCSIVSRRPSPRRTTEQGQVEGMEQNSKAARDLDLILESMLFALVRGYQGPRQAQDTDRGHG